MRSEPFGDVIVSEDIVRKLDFQALSIDFKNKKSLSNLSIRDIWGSPEKSITSYNQTSYDKQYNACLLLGGQVSTSEVLHINTNERMETLAKILKEDPSKYNVVVLAGVSERKNGKVEIDLIYERGSIPKSW